MTLSRSPHIASKFTRVAILFAGGAAPAANAVISAAATAFLRSGTEVLGIRNGFSRLVECQANAPLSQGEDYVVLDHSILRRTRNAQGVLIGTSRVQPGRDVTCRSHLEDSRRAQSLRSVYEALRSLNVEALISIGGDGTLETVNKLKLLQEQLPAPSQRLRLVHVPKAIDNDYRGIDFAFGYFTAVNALAGELRNLLHDAQASGAYFIVETVGRSAAWLPTERRLPGRQPSSSVSRTSSDHEREPRCAPTRKPEKGRHGRCWKSNAWWKTLSSSC